VVYVVGEHAGGDFYYEVVHLEVFSRCCFSVCQGVYCVPCSRAFVGVPFVLAESVEILGVHDCEFAH